MGNIISNFSFNVEKIVLQPTTLCNLNCRYCYLPDRELNNKMSVNITQRLSDYLISNCSKTFNIIWHGGEPLSCGIKHFKNLLLPFEGIKTKNSIQTNATLITDEWCELFKKHDFNVGVSIDGDSVANNQRKNWANKSSFEDTIKGIEILKNNNIDFHVIAVINNHNIDNTKRIYEFFSNLGVWSLGLNIEEIEGINTDCKNIKEDKIRKFWSEMFRLWTENPKIRIREFDYVLSWMDKIIDTNSTLPKRRIELLPTILWNGDVVFLSPELSGVKSKKYENFIIGNICINTFDEIISKASETLYVIDFVKGVTNCESTCEYYNFCGGGFASNKYAENKNLQSTNTKQCFNTKISLIEEILKSI